MDLCIVMYARVAVSFWVRRVQKHQGEVRKDVMLRYFGLLDQRFVFLATESLTKSQLAHCTFLWATRTM